MNASEQPKDEAERETAEDEARQPAEQPPAGGREVPLFLRDKNDGRQGNAQDEKDEIGE
jgi:hypothetical protein